jgi:hypothetical protein
MIEEIEKYVARIFENLSPSQKATLKALMFSGFKGERDHILLELLKEMGEDKISHSELTESFTCSFEGVLVNYSRIKPEYYRAVRKLLMKS